MARALASALERPVKIAQIPRPEWRSWYLRLGFSQAAADAYVRMTAASVEQGFERVGDAVRGLA